MRIQQHYRKYKNADQDDLWQHLTEAGHENGTLPDSLTVKTIMDSWTLQKGFPVITVTRVGNTSAVLTQEYFLLDRRMENSPSGGKKGGEAQEDQQKWWVPVTFTTQENPDFSDTKVRFWLSDGGLEPVSHIGYPEPHHWVLFNVQQTGQCIYVLLENLLLT